MWKKIRSGIMFVIACVASPCCTPLIVPLGLALLAGTPFAIWASAHLGWVYGGNARKATRLPIQEVNRL
jgi:hypothetical protein